MNEVVKSLVWAFALLFVAFFGNRLGLEENQANALIVIMIGGYVATIGKSRPCTKGVC